MKQFHPGVDLRATLSVSIFAPERIKILRTGTGQIYGEHFSVAEGLDSGFVFKFMHCKWNDSVLAGVEFAEGEIIAHSDCSGTDAAHLHFEVWPKGSLGWSGAPMDPVVNYLNDAAS
jgi:murein DD-endopeptidase MepM/ murein hydrolase activator NlpD